ncbi:hypothetical protein PILCRDRAFT_14863 [Piloderma croceum F 1598]|uniref:Uncharacterized protein n=1 Tax=Piloderma croceum (strain F 1598) TaxID=765440 RepID=A0A0C3AJ43_PILCF|nr:hypothetical protein PILCRDRAFT_14863 [Piloderma croceum F 1598]
MLPTEPIKMRPHTHSTPPSAPLPYESLPPVALNRSVVEQAMPAAPTSACNDLLDPIPTPENVCADIHSPQPTIVDNQPPSKRRKTARMSTGGQAPRRHPKAQHPSPHPKPENYTLPRGGNKK